MSREPGRFRFRPPAVAATAELRWTLTRAFAPAGSHAPPVEAVAVLDLAARLGLLHRIVSRSRPRDLEDELGAAATDRIRRERAFATAHELQHAETLAAVGRVASALGVVPVVLKGRALVLAGYAAPGSRLSSDLDLLVTPDEAPRLQRALVEAGFADPGGRRYEHQLSPLLAPGGVGVEVHLHLPGVRLERGVAAGRETLERLGWLADPGDDETFRWPARPVLIAHALLHALAQHGLSARGPGWALVADLIDLAAYEETGRPPAAWTENDLGEREVAAAHSLAGVVTAGDDPFAEPHGDVARLARHFVACALDESYGEALKARWLEAPLSERSRAAARVRLLASALTPVRTGRGGAGALAWLRRPFELARKLLRALRAQRRSAS